MGSTHEGASAVQRSSSKFEAGRGLDVGTANLASAIQDKEGNVTIKIQRNAFIDIDADDYTRNMLTKLNVQYVAINGKMVVVGDPAFELANILNRETRRPMKGGVISPNENEAMPIEKKARISSPTSRATRPVTMTVHVTTSAVRRRSSGE